MPSNNSKSRRAERRTDAERRDSVSAHRPEGRRLTAGDLPRDTYTTSNTRRPGSDVLAHRALIATGRA